MSPVNIMMTAMTEAKTGRWMKKFTIADRPARRSPALVRAAG
jgi:hypothetical protein